MAQNYDEKCETNEVQQTNNVPTFYLTAKLRFKICYQPDNVIDSC